MQWIARIADKFVTPYYLGAHDGANSYTKDDLTTGLQSTEPPRLWSFACKGDGSTFDDSPRSIFPAFVDFEVLFWSVDLSPRTAAVFSVFAVPPPVVGDRLARLLGACACRPLNGLAPFYSIEYVADVGFRRVVFRVKRFLKI